MQYLPLILLIIWGVVLTIGDLIMKKWVISDTTWLFILGIIVYTIGMCMMAVTFKYKNIAVASIMIVIFNVIFLSIISWLYFKEPLSYMQIFAIFLGLMSVVILEFS